MAPQAGLVATSPMPSWGGPQCSRAGYQIISAPQVGPVTTSPMLCWGFSKLSIGGQNHKCPTSGQIGYITPAILGVPNALDGRTHSEIAHNVAWWLNHPCCLGGSLTLHIGGQNQKCPKSGHCGYIAPVVGGGGGGSPTLQSRG